MSLIGTEIIEFELFLIGITATILFRFASKKNPYLKGWFYVVILSTLGIIANFLSHFFDIFDIASDLSYSISIAIASYIIIKEYYATFYDKIEVKIIGGMVFIEGFLLYSILGMAIILLLVDLVLQIRLALRKRNLTYGFLCLTLLGAMMTIFGNIFINLQIEGALAVNIGLDLFFTSMLVTTGVVALLEDKIVQTDLKYKDSYERASFYKDLVSHDISNILQGVRLSSDLISIKINESNNIKKIEELGMMINEQVERGTKLVKTVRTLSKVEESTIPLREVEALEILKQSIDFIRISHPNKNITIDKDTDFTKVHVKGNELLSDVFENILNNAIKHNNNQDVNISIITSKQEIDEIPYYKMEFKDNGNGVSDHLKERIFLKSHSINRKNSGMGLGLSLVKKIIDSFNGKIWVEDRVKGDPSKGSVFVIMIPEN